MEIKVPVIMDDAVMGGKRVNMLAVAEQLAVLPAVVVKEMLVYLLGQAELAKECAGTVRKDAYFFGHLVLHDLVTHGARSVVLELREQATAGRTVSSDLREDR